jgi:hypothetical protein
MDFEIFLLSALLSNIRQIQTLKAKIAELEIGLPEVRGAPQEGQM